MPPSLISRSLSCSLAVRSSLIGPELVIGSPPDLPAHATQQQPCRMLLSELTIITEKVHDMLKRHVNQECSSHSAAARILVKKKDNTKMDVSATAHQRYYRLPFLRIIRLLLCDRGTGKFLWKQCIKPDGLPEFNVVTPFGLRKCIGHIWKIYVHNTP